MIYMNTLFPRFILGWGAWLFYFIVAFTLSFFRKGDSPYLGWTTVVFNFVSKLVGHVTLFAVSFCTGVEEVE